MSIHMPANELVRSYAPGTPERADLQAKLAEMKRESFELASVINGESVTTGTTDTLRPPHELSHMLGQAHLCGSDDVQRAIDGAVSARAEWARTPFEERAAIFLRAAELLETTWRDTINAATMLGQSKNAFQAEIDSACELIDFWRFNVAFAEKIRSDQPISPEGVSNCLEYRPLEGFVFAVSPFNFTSIAGNLPTAPALMGNTVVWKPARTSALSSWFIYQLLVEAGLPAGVINMVFGSGRDVGDVALASEHLAGLHFTGSTEVFQSMWRTVGGNIDRYRSYPRIVGETGGKDFIVAHESSDPIAVATAILRGAFEYQGQKCSAASRVYIPDCMWDAVKDKLLADLAEVRMGTVEDFGNFVNAVIDKSAFDRISGYIDHARNASDAEIIAGGGYSDADGYFIEPTVILTTNAKYKSMCAEIFGPVVTIFVYPASDFAATLKLVDETSPYALTGAIFANDESVIDQARDALLDSAGNFYINDKPTGAVVGQQPFGGGRASGTNDKAGALLNLTRWVSPRTVKRTFEPPMDFRYPFLSSDN